MTNKGFVLVTSIFVSVILTILTMSMGVRSLSETQLARQYDWQDRAFQLAEASIDETMRACVIDCISWSKKKFADGRYWAEVATVIPDSLYRVHSHGEVQTQQVNLEAYIETIPESVFGYPIVGDVGLKIAGDVTTDSYDSALGAYDPATAGDGGDVATNSTNPNAVKISGGVEISGQIQVGTDSVDPDAGVKFSGSSFDVSDDPPVDRMTHPLPMDSVIVPAGLPCSDKTMSDVADSDMLTEAAGPYCFRDLSISGGAVLSVSGDVTVYITGKFSMSGGSIAGNSASPPNLIVNVASGPSDPVSFTGGSVFYGGVYAPGTEVQLHGDTTIYGSVVAHFITITGSNNTVHFDEQMRKRIETPGRNTPYVRAWREI